MQQAMVVLTGRKLSLSAASEAHSTSSNSNALQSCHEETSAGPLQQQQVRQHPISTSRKRQSAAAGAHADPGVRSPNP
jgi:hypothetical protein